MKILVLGSGAREHALVWRLQRDQDVTLVLAAPGNPGIEHSLPIRLDDPAAILALAESEGVDLTVVGPELPLAAGVVDRFRDAGHPILGPTAAAARLETSKAFAKAFMQRHRIPTARFEVATSAEEGLSIVASGRLGWPLVIKADGLAGGKGVVIALDPAEAHLAVRAAMIEGRFGAAGGQVVFEECLTGPEVSVFALCDGRTARLLLSAQDHKRAYDGDQGPNTGGMGAFAPSPLLTPALARQVMGEIIDPVVAGMLDEGHPFSGFLYAGLMLTPSGPKVIEFNVRFGDPEAQVVLPALAGPFARVLLAAAQGTLATAPPLEWTEELFAGVVLASGGYPGDIETGFPIDGLDDGGDALVFHASTAAREGRIVTAGGRVLTVVGRGATYGEAIDRAYDAAARIKFEKMFYRRDIGRSAL